MAIRAPLRQRFACRRASPRCEYAADDAVGVTASRLFDFTPTNVSVLHSFSCPVPRARRTSQLVIDTGLAAGRASSCSRSKSSSRHRFTIGGLQPVKRYFRQHQCAFVDAPARDGPAPRARIFSGSMLTFCTPCPSALVAMPSRTRSAIAQVANAGHPTTALPGPGSPLPG